VGGPGPACGCTPARSLPSLLTGPPEGRQRHRGRRRTDGNLDSSAVWPVGPAAFDLCRNGCCATRVKGPASQKRHAPWPSAPSPERSWPEPGPTRARALGVESGIGGRVLVRLANGGPSRGSGFTYGNLSHGRKKP